MIKIRKLYRCKNNPSVIISWAFVLLWLAFIFFLSSQPAKDSNALSKSVAKVVITGAKQVHPKSGGSDAAAGVDSKATAEATAEAAQSNLSALNSRLREYAHASVFFVLALLVSNAFRRSGVKGFRAFLYAFLFCAVYACSDEFHQLFVPGRAMQLIDFTLDCTGALLGLGLCSFIVFISRKIRHSA